MLKRRLLAFALSACLLCGSCFTTAAGAEGWTNIDDLDIDPWGDLEDVQSRPSPSFEPPAEPPVMYPGMAGEMPSVQSLVPGDVGNYNVSFNTSLAIGYKALGTSLSSLNYNPATAFSDMRSNQGLPLAYIKCAGNSTGTVEITPQNDSPDGVSIIIQQWTSFVPESNSKLTLNGSILHTLNYRVASDTTHTGAMSNFLTKPDKAYILINGKRVGGYYSLTSEGRIIFSNKTIDLSSYAGKTITSFGWEFVYNRYHESEKSVSLSTPNHYLLLYIKYDEVGFTANWETPPAPTPTPPPTPTPTPAPPTDEEMHEETKGILERIISAIQGIFTGIVELPGKIVNALLDGLKALFVPSEEDLADLKNRYETLLSERLGFVWQAGTWITSFFEGLVEAFKAGEVYTFVFPGVSFPMNGETVTIIEEQTVSLENAFMDVVRPVLTTIIAIVCVLSFIGTAEDMVVAITSGASYFDYLNRKKGGG